MNSFITFSPFLFDDFAAVPRGTLYDLDFPPPSTKQTKGDFRLSLDLPGVKVEDLNIQVDEGVLEISGARRVYPDGRPTKKARFSRSIALDEDIDVSKVRANLSDGVLIVTAPRIPKPAPIRVQISTKSLEEAVDMDQKKIDDASSETKDDDDDTSKESVPEKGGNESVSENEST